MRSLSMFIITLAMTACATVTVRTLPDGKTAAAKSFDRDGMTYVSIADAARAAGFKAARSAFNRRVTVSNNSGKIAFAQDNPFYIIDTAAAALPFPPIEKDGELYLPAVYLAAALGAKHPGTINWNAQGSVITVNTSKHNVLSISGEVKQNGTVVSIALGDSLAYESVYFHPNLVFTFKDGKLAPKPVRRSGRTGLIDSTFTRQHDGSAQVSFILNQRIEAPHIDYVSSKRTLMVSLKPYVEPKKTPVPASRQIPVDVSTIRTVVIDPGHGGRDPGAIGGAGVMEKDVVLAISIELRKLLEKAGFKVLMTREKDVFIPLRDRTNFANEKKADLFVSVHANAIDGDKKKKEAIRGYKIYFLSQAKNEEDKLAAMRENAVIELEDKDKRRNYDALQDVLISIAGSEYLRESQELSIIMEQTFGAKQKNIPRSQLGVGQANFWVLNGAYMPAVLVEVGYITNPTEEKLLSDKRVQYQQAAALSEAIIKFKEMYEAGQ